MPEEAVETVEAPEAPPRQEAVSELTERFTRGLDKVAPLPKKKEAATEAQVEAPEPPVPAPAPPEPEPEPPKKEPKRPSRAEEPGQLLPSFLKEKEAPAQPDVPEEELPEEIPGGKNAKHNWKKFRDNYSARGEKLKAYEREIAELKGRVGQPDPVTSERIKQLEEKNKELLGITERVSIQNHPRFVNEILQPRANAVEFAKGIVRDAGGDPAHLERALAVTGPSHYAALEELYSGLPEVAKGELSAVIKDIRLYDRRRDQILADPARSLEAIRKEDLVAQQRQLEQQNRDGEAMLERIMAQMREHNKVEVLQRSNDPKDKWWNDQVDMIENTARQLAKTSDQETLMAAVVMAPMADAYRKLFLESQKEISRLRQRVASFESHEPTTEGEPEPLTTREQRKKDLTKPIGQAFREILLRNRNSQ